MDTCKECKGRYECDYWDKCELVICISSWNYKCLYEGYCFECMDTMDREQIEMFIDILIQEKENK